MSVPWRNMSPPFALTLYKLVKRSEVGQFATDIVLERHLAIPFAPSVGLIVQDRDVNGDETLYEELLSVRYDVPTGGFEADTRADTELAVSPGNLVVGQDVYRKHIAELCGVGWGVPANQAKYL